MCNDCGSFSFSGKSQRFFRFAHRSEWRNWLISHHAIEKSVWILIQRGKEKMAGALLYLDAVEEALCFGWIDATLQKASDTETVQRFSPRRPGGHWTELNKERFRRLERIGKMTEAGRFVYPYKEENHFCIRSDILFALQADPVVWKKFQAFPALYQRVRIDNLQGYPLKKHVFQSRLQKLIENTRKGKLYGSWNDDGRLWPTNEVNLEKEATGAGCQS